ncbi:MAG TPA: flavodoxin [Firmicutes bacterium]|nr:flavodoxin [Bacillota bacterium]
MKKLTSLVLGLILAIGLASCSSQTPQASSSPSAYIPSSSENPAVSSAPSAQNSEEAQTPAQGGGRTLVVYFSATGNTQEAADYIAQLTGGDLFELVPADPYTDEDLNYSNQDSRVVYEHDNPDARNIELVANTVENWSEYDTIFIGYPIWWGIAAWPVDTFIQNNDFTGKTVIPFCTSASSGLGQSGELLEDMAGTGNWLEGHRFSSRVSQEDVQAWLDSLNL